MAMALDNPLATPVALPLAGGAGGSGGGGNLTAALSGLGKEQRDLLLSLLREIFAQQSKQRVAATQQAGSEAQRGFGGARGLSDTQLASINRGPDRMTRAATLATAQMVNRRRAAKEAGFDPDASFVTPPRENETPEEYRERLERQRAAFDAQNTARRQRTQERIAANREHGVVPTASGTFANPDGPGFVAGSQVAGGPLLKAGGATPDEAAESVGNLRRLLAQLSLGGAAV